MKIKTKFFGEINIADEQIILFPYGIYGFENSNRFVLLHDEENEENENSGGGYFERESETVFRWLQCVDDENLCFTVMEPKFIESGYNPKLPDNTLQKLGAGAGNEKDLIYLVIAVIYDDVENSTANLLGPVVINSKNKVAAQIILESAEPQNSEYKIKHKIFSSIINTKQTEQCGISKKEGEAV
ncbi:MAG: flagellar assembly protein FliW [Oscillospiraceae bacterium]|nr:flagellar assembly protein FliW [Oscillospiraceae bacterium]